MRDVSLAQIQRYVLAMNGAEQSAVNSLLPEQSKLEI